MTRSRNVGFRVFTEIPRPPRALIESFSRVEPTFLSDAMNRFGGMGGNIRPVDPAMRLAGPAVTVRVAPGDNLMVYKAFEVAKPGDVLVIEARGFTAVAQWGDLTSMVGKALGLGGVVTDGSLRDLEGIRKVGLPVFAQPIVVPNGGLKDGPGEVNVPVAVGGVPVLPGDIVVGDANGVVVVPLADAEVVLATAEVLMADEARKVQGYAQGNVINEWLGRVLQEKGCEIFEGRRWSPGEEVEP